MNKDVSIIVPVYKIEEVFLRECLDSLTALESESAEILLIDDGSPDNSGAICDEYAAKDTRVRVVHKENAGVSAARNDGIRLAQGKYVTFVDADDVVDAACLDRQIARLKTDDCEMAACGYYEQDKVKKTPICPFAENRVFEAEADLIELRKMAFGFGFGQKKMKKSGFFAVWTKFYRADFLAQNALRFREGMAFAEDQLFAFSALAKCKKVRYSTDGFYFYRLRKSSVCHVKRDAAFPEIELFFESFKAAIDACENSDAYKNAMAVRYFDNLILRSAAKWELGKSAWSTFGAKCKALRAQSKKPSYKTVMHYVRFSNYDFKGKVILALFRCHLFGVFLAISALNKRIQKEQDNLF